MYVVPTQFSDSCEQIVRKSCEDYKSDSVIVLQYIYIRLCYQEVTQESIRPEQSHFQKNKTEKKSTSRKKECANAYKSLCVKPQALLWLWEANVKPMAYLLNA